MKTDISTIADLILAYPVADVRNKMTTAFKKLGPDILEQSPQAVWNALDIWLEALNCISNRKSRSAHKAQIVKCLRHGTDISAISVLSSSVGDDAEFPSFEVFAAGTHKNQSTLRTAWNAFTRFTLSRKLSMITVRRHHLEDYREWLDGQVFDSRRIWNVFILQWETAASRGIVPNFGLKPYPSKKPLPYALDPATLPDNLKRELDTAIHRQRQQGLGSRFRKRLIAESTVELRTDIVCRYLGFYSGAGHDLQALPSLADGFTEVSIIDYLLFTNSSGSLDDMGEYQKSLLVAMEQFLRHGLLSDEKADMVREIWTFYSNDFYLRREIAKPQLYLDNLYQIIATLLVHSAATEQPIRERVLCIRDAIIFLLLASFAFRREVLLNLRLDSTFKKSTAGERICYLVEIPKEITKPKLRDCYYEILDQYYSLVDYYCCYVRPYLLKGKVDDGFLLRAQSGKKLSSQSIYAIVRRRSLEVLGREINPHLARKALATEWLKANPRDLITLSLVMDCSVNTIQTSYAQPRPVDACRQFDQRAAQKSRASHDETLGEMGA